MGRSHTGSVEGTRWTRNKYSYSQGRGNSSSCGNLRDFYVTGWFIIQYATNGKLPITWFFFLFRVQSRSNKAFRKYILTVSCLLVAVLRVSLKRIIPATNKQKWSPIFDRMYALWLSKRSKFELSEKVLIAIRLNRALKVLDTHFRVRGLKIL